MLGAGVLSLLAGYRRARVFSFLHPGHDVGNTGYQLYRSLIAIGSGGLNGVGLGAGRAKWFFLPNAHTDFIFAIIGEELGFIGCLLVLALFVGLGLVGLRIARRAPDRFGMLIATGVTAWIVGQAAINLGAVVGRPARLGRAAAVPVGRRHVARDHDVQRRRGGEHRASACARAAPGRVRGHRNVRCATGRREPRRRTPGAPEPEVFALLTGGGTGGHTYPAIAVAQELVRRGHTVRFVGGRRGIEGRVVPEAGFGIDLLPGRGLQRRLTIANVAAIWGAMLAVVRAIAIVRRYRPRVVVGFGGYASFPCVLAARLLRVPVVVHEQDAAPGLANRMGVRIGARPAVSLPDTPLPHATLTGNPVRAAFTHLERVARPAGDPALVAVFGGAQGARSINRAALGCYDLWRTRRDLTVHHVCGPRNLDACESELASARRPGDVLHYELVAYEERMDLLYGRAALAVCRAGRRHRSRSSPRPGCPRCSCRFPARPATTRPGTRGRSSAPVRRSCCRDDECDPEHLDRVVSELLREHRPAGADGRGRARPRAARRRGAPRGSRGGPRPCRLTPRRRRVATELDLSQPRRVHIVGVAGAGMSAIALVLARMGHAVSGSDIKNAAVLERLAAAGVAVHVGNRAEYVPADADAVVYSTAIPRRNVELVAAAERGIPVLHRSAALAALAANPPHDRSRGFARQDDDVRRCSRSSCAGPVGRRAS